MINEYELHQLIDNALQEDVRDGDHTSLAVLEKDTTGNARLLVKEEGILCGVDIAQVIFKKVDSNLTVECKFKDGDPIKIGDIVLNVYGSAISILTAERLVLNCMQRMSGIATTTNTYVKAIEGTGAKVMDTRKTTPNLRFLEKYAVTVGGGYNHRFGLYDMILLKDNHIDFCGGISKAIHKAHHYLEENHLKLNIEVETRNLEDVREVLECGGIDRIMLDNFTPEQVREAVALIAGRYATEASGGIHLNTIRAFAETGVNYISVGALTHSVKSLDLSLKAEIH
jgi:nicotinate-nucleotide pyrophosphorylase (carboxylating)